MFVPVWILLLGLALVSVGAMWTFLLASGKNPLPFPDRGSRIFAASSAEAKTAIVALLSMHGLKERFQFNTGGVVRSILWDGTIINYSSPDITALLGSAASSIGMVSDNPSQSAESAATFLRSRGFEARVVLDAEPDLPIAFVVTDALLGTVLNFRRHVIHMPRPTAAT